MSSEISKAPPMAICDSCGQYRQVHQRHDPDTGEERVLCKNCYLQEHPPKRSKDFCKRCKKYKTIWARGLCRSCLDWVYYHDKRDDYPTLS